MRTGFFPFTEPSVEFDITCYLCDGAGCSVCKHSGWIEMGGAGVVDPNVFEASATTRGVVGLRVRARDRRIAFLRHGLPDLRLFWENDLRFRGGSRFRLVAARVRRFDWPSNVAAKLVFTSCEVDRSSTRRADGDGNLGRFLVGRVVEAGKHPNADRLQLCQVDVGEGEPRQIVCGPGTSAPARPSPSRSRGAPARRRRYSARRSCAASSPTG